MMKEINETVRFLKQSGIGHVDCTVILGTGIGEFVNHIKIEKQITYSAIPNFPVATVEFRKGNIIYGKVGNARVLAIQRRLHYYEEYSLQQVAFPIRVIKMQFL